MNALYSTLAITEVNLYTLLYERIHRELIKHSDDNECHCWVLF